MHDEAIIRGITEYNLNLEKEYNEKKEKILKIAFNHYINNSEKDLYQHYIKKLQDLTGKYYKFKACNTFIMAAHINTNNWATILRSACSPTKTSDGIPKNIETLEELCKYAKKSLDEPAEEIVTL